MIQLTRIASDKNNSAKLFIIPGGPGLSSLTLRGLDLLKSEFELVYLDFQGTNESKYVGKKTYDEISSAISDVIKNESGTKFVLGHSFGGFFAVDAFLNDSALGVLCLSTPFLKSTLMSAGKSYSENSTPELLDTEKNWEDKRDNLSFAKWLSSYGPLYFINPDGRKILADDKVSAQFFLDNRGDALLQEAKLANLKSQKGLKLFVCGSNDKLLSLSFLKEDALCGGFDFVEINGASHFVTIDQPEKLSQIIIEKINFNLKGEI